MIYDQSTTDRLQWQYGGLRTADIVFGRDAATEADLAAWRNLGGAVPVSRTERCEWARAMLSQGASIEAVVAACDLDLHTVRTLDGGVNPK